MRRKRAPIVSSAVAFRLSRFSGPYRQRLLAGLRDLQEFCVAEAHCSLTFILSHIHRADELLAEYVLQRHKKSEGQKLYVVKHALLCCQHIQPRLKGHIGTAWANLSLGRTENPQVTTTASCFSLVDDDRFGPGTCYSGGTR